MASLTSAVSIDLFSVQILSLLNFAFVMSHFTKTSFITFPMSAIFSHNSFCFVFFFFPILLEPTTAVSLFFYELSIAIGKSKQTDKASLEPTHYVNDVLRHQGKIKHFIALCAR